MCFYKPKAVFLEMCDFGSGVWVWYVKLALMAVSGGVF